MSGTIDTQPPNTGALAVVGTADGPATEPLRAYIAAHPATDVKWFAPRDLNDLEDAIEAGRFGRVLFAEPADFLEAVWSGDIKLQEWRIAGVRLEFAAPEHVGLPVDPIWRLAERFEHWRAGRRRAKLVSCRVLSAIAIAAAFGVIWAAR